MREPRDRLSIRIGEIDLDPLPDQDADVLQLPQVRGRRVRVLVQFRRPLTREDRARVRRYGVLLSDYVPELTYLELLDADALDRLSRDPAFRAAVPYRTEFKVAPRIGQRAYRTPERRNVAGLWLELVLFAEADPAATSRRLRAYGADDIQILDARAHGGVAQIRATVEPEAALDRIAELEDVRWVDEVSEWVEDNTRAAATLQSGDAGAHSIWAAGLHGEGQIIGVIDSTRISMGHCFFRDASNNAPGPAHRKVVALRDATGGDATLPTDHATFVAGCAAGDDFGRPGENPHRGGAWAARLAIGNTKDLKRTPLLSELIAAAEAGATVHTNSWHNNTAGNRQPATYNQSSSDVDRFMWQFEDHVVVGSAGNQGEEQGPPGTAKNAICVGATQSHPDEMTFGDGNSGPTADGRRKPDLLAPGGAIESSKVNTVCKTSVKRCQSSWAAPHAAAACALVRQYFTEGYYPSGVPNPDDAFTPSGALLKAMLLNSTIDVAGSSGYPGDQEGWGLLRLDNVLGFPGSRRNVRVWGMRNADGLLTGDVRTHHVDVGAAARSLKITLVWTDAPASAGSGLAIVNDLDLEVVAPDGEQLFRGNWFVDGVSATGGRADCVNNVEMVLVMAPVPGTWTVRIAAPAVNVRGAQGYALVATTARE